MSKRAVVLVSGGIDSATALACAKKDGYDCFALSVDYGQRHVCELNAATAVAQHIGVAEHKVISIDLTKIGGSALTDNDIAVPSKSISGIPITYVPARNTIFLSIALGWAEVLGAQNIFIGVNAVDYSGYPDCRQTYIDAFENMANFATKAGVEGKHFKINTPLIDLTKSQIIELGQALQVDYSLTISCYDPDSQCKACGVCDSCRIRADGFQKANLVDPTQYKDT